MTNIENITLTVEQIAFIYEKDVRTVQRYFADLDRSKGEYKLIDCVRHREKILLEEIYELKMGDKELVELKKRDQLWKSNFSELKYKKELKTLVDFAEVKLAWLEEVENFRKALNSLKYRLTTALQGVVDEKISFPIINDTVDETQISMSEFELRSSEDEDEYEEIVFEDIDEDQ